MSRPSTSNSSLSAGGSQISASSQPVVKYRFPPNGLLSEYAEGLENLRLYQSGGHHPVHLDDLLGHEKQYRVIGKLGTGGFGNVWLCQNVKRTPSEYVAVKILMAELSSDESTNREAENLRRLQELAARDADIKKYCLLPLDDFALDGPNGTHQCFAYPVAGPSAGKFSIHVPSPTNTLRRVIRQAVEAMAALHRHGVCHGDFRPGNVLLKLDGLNGLRVKEVCEYFDYPYISDIEVAEGYPNPGSSAPKYVVCPAKPENDRLATEANLCVIDYGEAFDPASPPENGVGIPLAYCAPEIILERKCGFASDIWALAATIFEIRTGDKLFKLGFNEEDYYLDILVEMFGPMPEPWWSTTWQNRGEYWRDEADANGRAVPRDEESGPSDSSIIRELGGDILHFFLSPRGKWIDVQVPEKEKPIFEDLLRMMMKWKPEDRPSAEDVLKHPWFTLDDEEGELFQEMKIKIFESENEETDDEESGDDSKDDEIEDKAEAGSDGVEDGEMLDGEMEGADAENSQPNPHRQESLKLHEKDDKKIAVSRDTKESHKHDQKDGQEDGQEDVDEQIPYHRVEQMEYQKEDQQETPKVDSQVEKVKENLLVSEKAGLLKVAVDARFRGVADWVKKALKWSRK